MGVPSLFKNIVKKYPDTYYWKHGELIEYLFMDYNSLMHNVTSKYISQYGKTTDSKLINAIIEETIKIRNIINPQKLLYIAMDGVVPMGKMHQQRSRRYKAMNEQTAWDRSANLSPQTKFMKAFSKKMKKTITDKKFGNIDVIFSDTSEPGEGEHKIIPYIKKLVDSGTIGIKIENGVPEEIKVPRGETICIMGQDADLIVLAYAFFANRNVLILQEYTEEMKMKGVQIDEPTQYFYFSVREYQKAYFKELDVDLRRYDEHRLIVDHVFLTSLGGDDFVKALPFLKVKENVRINDINMNSQEFIYSSYKQVLSMGTNEYLITKTLDLNIPFFKQIISKLMTIEQILGQQRQKYINEYMKPNSRFVQQELEREKASNKSEEEIMKLRMEHTPYYSPLHPEHNKYKNVFKVVDYFKNPKVWKGQYYKYFFDATEQEYIALIVNEYVKSLVWTLKYYFGEISSWDWYYHFRVAPFPSDIMLYLQDNTKFEFEKNTQPVSSEQQLAIIMPPTKASMLKKSNQKFLLSKESPIIQYYPMQFELDVLDGGKYIYSEAILPRIDLKKIRKYVK